MFDEINPGSGNHNRTVYVSIQTQDFDVSAELECLRSQNLAVGALCSFVGTVRADQQTQPTAKGQPGVLTVSDMELEHYPGMTERTIEAMVQCAYERFSLLGVRVIHRVGRLCAGEQIVLVAVASSHRRDSFQACEFLMDYLKTQAPFWKKVRTEQGWQWVDARVNDDEALERWGIQSANSQPSS